MNYLKAQTRLAELVEQFRTKGNGNAMTTAELKAWNTEADQCQQVIDGRTKAMRFAGGHALGGDGAPPAGHGAGAISAATSGLRGKAAQFAPLGFNETQLKSMHAAIQSRSSFAIRTKDFSTVDSLLPPELIQTVVGPQYETRLLDRLPIRPTTAPSIEIIRHLSTTGSPAITAEGAVKPELKFNTDRVILPVQKIAAHAAISWETLTDWDVFVSYFMGEIQRQIIDAENEEILNGDGTTGHLAGLLNTSGILTHATATDTGIDAVELAIAKLRTGSALAEADLFVVHPSTWSALRRTKDAQDRYLVASDPTQGAANTLWGVPVLPTTTIAAGVGALLDSRKFGYVVVREALSLRTGTNDDDFTRNLQRWVGEERLALAVERPSAVVKITGLPVA